jgi:hypothetical protein
MTETDQIEVAEAETVAAVVADIIASGVPREESPEDRDQRMAEWCAREARNRERERLQQAQREAELVAELDAEQAEQARIEQARIEAVKRDLRERSAQRERERQAHADRERLAHVEAQLRNEQARREREAQEKAASAHWLYLSERMAEMDRIVNPPRDVNAERIAALEQALEEQAGALNGPIWWR